jgi:hypothetical protein
MNDGQLQRKLSQGDSLHKLYDTLSNSTTIGRLTSRLFKQNGIPFSEVELNKFIEKYKARWESKYTISNIRLVEGEEIRKWYLEDNYTSEKTGTLKNSCMRFRVCQDYFDIYTKNPKKVKLAIKTKMENGVEKLLSRALVWQTDKGIYLDRVYYTHPQDEHLFDNWAKKNLGCFSSYSDTYMLKMMISLDSKVNFDKLPHIDTFLYLEVSPKKKTWTLYNYEVDLEYEGDVLYRCHTADGSLYIDKHIPTNTNIESLENLPKIIGFTPFRIN